MVVLASGQPHLAEKESAMKAIVLTGYGSIDRLELRDVPRPEPGPGEVLVRVRAASLHPDVWHVVMGRPAVLRLMGAGLLRPKQPIPGTDMAGVVEAVGDGATRFRPGTAVFGETVKNQWTNGGTLAEYVAAPEALLARKPDTATFEEAASVPTSGYVALINLRHEGRTGPGKRVLINGAAGGVGALALQIIKARGAHVTAVDSTRKLETLRELGADAVVDYTREDFTARDERYDLVFDVPGNHPYSKVKRVLEPDGRYVLIGHEGYGERGGRTLGVIPHVFGLAARSAFDQRLRGAGTPYPPRHDAMETLRSLLEAGRITPVIDSTWSLAQIREAFRHMMEDELRGKVLITPGPGHVEE